MLQFIKYLLTAFVVWGNLYFLTETGSGTHVPAEINYTHSFSNVDNDFSGFNTTIVLEEHEDLILEDCDDDGLDSILPLKPFATSGQNSYCRNNCRKQSHILPSIYYVFKLNLPPPYFSLTA